MGNDENLEKSSEDFHCQEWPKWGLDGEDEWLRCANSSDFDADERNKMYTFAWKCTTRQKEL